MKFSTNVANFRQLVFKCITACYKEVLIWLLKVNIFEKIAAVLIPKWGAPRCRFPQFPGLKQAGVCTFLAG